MHPIIIIIIIFVWLLLLILDAADFSWLLTYLACWKQSISYNKSKHATSHNN